MTTFEQLLFAERTIHADWVQQFAQCVEREAHWLDACHQLIQEMYTQQPSARDGYSRMGVFLLEQKKPAEALPWFEKDAATSRATWWCQLRHAECIAVLGDLEQATSRVARVYESASTAVNGYASLAQRLRAVLPKDKLLSLLQADIKQGRLSAGFRLNVAVLLATHGDVSAAIKQVEQAYKDNASLLDGFWRIGKVFAQRGDHDHAFSLFEREAKAGRLSSRNLLEYATLLARRGLLQQAADAIRKAADTGAGSNDAGVHLLDVSPDPVDLPLIMELGRLDQAANLMTAQGHKHWLEKIRTQATAELELKDSQASFSGIRLADQWNNLQRWHLSGKSPADPMPILNAKLFIDKPRDAMTQFREIIFHQNYFFEPAGTIAPFIVDGGANIGMAMAYFKWLYPQARILAFEPNPYFYEICRRNIELNGWTQVKLRPEALFERSGFVTFNILEKNPMGSGVTTRLKDATETQTADVPCCLLSSCLQSPTDFLKLDIEGAETGVLREAAQRLPLVQRGYIEYHYDMNQKCNPLGALLSILEQHGFYYRVEAPSAQLAQWPQALSIRMNQHWSCSIFFKRTP